MVSRHYACSGGREHDRTVDGAKLVRLLTLCFTLAVALACTGQPFHFSSGSSGGSKPKKKRKNKSVVLVVPDSVDAELVNVAPTESTTPVTRLQGR